MTRPRLSRLIPLLLISYGYALAQDSTFTYQGYLTESGTAADGSYDFELALYNLAIGGTAIDVNAFDDVTVTGGLFSLPADFTGAPFEAGGDYWVEARVRDGADAGAYTPLLPRQPVNASPYAIAAQAVIAPLDVAGDANVQGELTVNGDITTPNELRAERVEADEIWTDGPADLLGGAVIQRGGDNVALVVENSGPTQPAARVVGNIEIGGTVECGSSECVPLASLQAGAYRSRAELYRATGSQSVSPGLNGAVQAACNDANDLPLAGSCPGSSGRVVGTDLIDWANQAVPAAFECTINNTTSTQVDISAAIVCVSVP